jgi:hypothetical protein
MELVAGDPKIISGPVEISSDDPRRRIFAYRVRQGETVRDVPVTISAALTASSPSNPLFAAIVATKGRSRLEESLSKGRVPPRITIQFMEATFGEDVD